MQKLKHIIFQNLLNEPRIYPKVNYFDKIEDSISLENDQFQFLNVISSLKTTMYKIFFFEPPPWREKLLYYIF